MKWKMECDRELPSVSLLEFGRGQLMLLSLLVTKMTIDNLK